MKAPHALGAIGAVILAAIMTSSADAGEIIDGEWISIGQFQNDGPGEVNYVGDFASYVSASVEQESGEHTHIDIDLPGLLVSLNFTGMGGVRIVDSGVNVYGANSPGADVDLLRFDQLIDGTEVTLLYNGPNPIHTTESESQLALRVAVADAQSGDQDSTYMRFVSLGDGGMLTAMFDQVQATGLGLPPNHPLNTQPTFTLSEHGFGESFQVQVLATELVQVPAPGVAAMFGVVGIFAGRRRRRR